MFSRFISLPWKILAITLIAMLMVSSVITIVSLWQFEDNFIQRQQEKRQSSAAIYQYLRSISSDKRVIWQTALGAQHLNDELKFDSFDNAVQKQFDLDELRVDAVWIIGDNGEELYRSDVPATEQVFQVAQSVLTTPSIQDLVYCDSQIKSCFHIVAMPVMTGQGKLMVLLSRANLSDLLFTFMMLSENTQLALVNIQTSGSVSDDLQSMKVYTKTNNNQTQSVIDYLPKQTKVSTLQQGLVADINGQYFSIYLLDLQPNAKTNNYLLAIEDISEYHLANKQYQYTLVLIALIIFVLISFFVFYFSRRASSKLLSLAHDLPLLAEKRFKEFKQRKQYLSKYLSDELDIVIKSSSKLAEQLEDLHIENIQNTRELENIAMYDLLTGLPNRNVLNFQLKKALSNLSRQSESLAVLFLDLDDFKKVNDSHGHNTGDRMLEEAARRLTASVRQGDIACRFGGDEFVIILPKINSWLDVENVANKLIKAFKKPIEVDSHKFYVSTSIGAAIAKADNISAEELIRNADMAMYEAKEQGGNCFKLYDSGMHLRVANKVLLETEVRTAMQQNQFSLSLQPQINIVTGRLFGFEALLRWKHPTKGFISPNEFIPIIENSKHIVDLGYWVIKHSIELLAQLEQAGYKGLGIAINLSAEQFIDPDLPKYLKRQCKAFKISTSQVELELTERTLVTDVEKTLATMNELKALGFTFSIDDFGTGYSSLSYLKQMPVDCIKIDKCFISGMLENQADMQIVTSTITMVHGLGMKVTAEGVENRAQLRILKRQGCDLVQGYLFSKPIEEHKLLEQLNLLVDKGLWTQAAQTDYYQI